MYLKKSKSRKRDTKTKSKYIIKCSNNMCHTRIKKYSIKKGGATTNNDGMSDAAMHLYIEGIKMDEKPETEAIAEFVDPPVSTEIRTNAPKKDRPSLKPRTKKTKNEIMSLNNSSIVANAPQSKNANNLGILKPALSSPNETQEAKMNNNPTILAPTLSPTNVTQEAKIINNPNILAPALSSKNVNKLNVEKPPPLPQFNIEEFMKLLNALYNNANSLTDISVKYTETISNNSFKKYLVKFTTHSNKLMTTTIKPNINSINQIKITTKNTIFDSKNKWIILLKNILVDLLACISESLYVLKITETEYIDIQSRTTRKKTLTKKKKPNTNNSSIDEVDIINTTNTKKKLNDIQLPELSIKYSIGDLLGNTEKVIKFGTASVGTLPKDNSLDHAMIRLLYDILYQSTKSHPNKVQNINNLLLEVQYLMNKMNEIVQTELAKPPPKVLTTLSKAPQNSKVINSPNNSKLNKLNLPGNSDEFVIFLTDIRLQQFAPKLIKEGFNKLDSLIDEVLLDDDKLENIIGMSKDEVERFREAVNQYSSRKKGTSNNVPPIVEFNNVAPVVESNNKTPTTAESINNRPPIVASNNRPPIVASNNRPPIVASNNKPPVVESNNVVHVVESNNKTPTIAESNNAQPVVKSINAPPIKKNNFICEKKEDKICCTKT